VTIVSDTPADVEVQGSAKSGTFCNEYPGNGYPRQDYTVYFDITFSQPFTRSRVITQPGRKDPNALFLVFNTTTSRVIDAKVAISYVSAADAKLNWQTEDPGWNFTPIRTAAQAAWNALLTKISVWGGATAQTQEFYSLLYKALLQPNITSDVNGEYLGSDYQPHTLTAGQQDQYGMFSGWDTYHGQAQLVAMLDPAAASDMAQSLVNEYTQNSVLPEWGYLNIDNYTMVGDPDDAVIAIIDDLRATNCETAEALNEKREHGKARRGDRGQPRLPAPDQDLFARREVRVLPPARPGLGAA
jgi:putative alpha-1,2-mannosidase